MKITYYYDHVGMSCEKCGRTIKNIFVLESNGVTFKVGSECIQKISSISNYGLKELKKDLKNIESTKQKYNEISKPIEQLLVDNAENYGMIEMTKAEKDACDWEQTWRMRTNEEYTAYIEELRWFYPESIKNKINEINKKYKNITLK